MLPALCGVPAGSENAQIAHRKGNSLRASPLAKPLLTSSDDQGTSLPRTVSVGGHQRNASYPAAVGESAEVREDSSCPQTGARFNNPCINGCGQNDANRPLQLDASNVPIANPFDGKKASELAGKFTDSIRYLLRGAPKRFKELYVMIAERQPQDCPAQGNKVSLASMGWLHEIQRELQEIATNRDGLWHLKETTAARYDREELYEKVWAQPIQTLAKEYGGSDVALARACRRRRIPLPGRGYWAKKAAGKPVPDRHYPRLIPL